MKSLSASQPSLLVVAATLAFGLPVEPVLAQTPSARACEVARRRGDNLPGCPTPRASPVPQVSPARTPALSPAAMAIQDALGALPEREWLATDEAFDVLETQVRSLGTVDDLRAIAQSGNRRAQYLLGRAYWFGQFGVQRNTTRAVEWYRRAASLGDTLAQVDLGYAYSSGTGLTRDDGAAARFYGEAAERGFGLAQYNLGTFYRDGRGVRQDHGRALSLFRQAADREVREAFMALGSMYESGRGTPRNYAEAARWYREGATRGDPKAQGALGGLLYEGRPANQREFDFTDPGIPANQTEGLMWLRRATAAGDQWARDYLAQRGLSPE